MKTKRIQVKKIPYYLALTLLTVGASLILGFLSFGGMYAFLPILPLAFAAFGLSVAYESEIYLQNIKGALDKLLQRNYLKRRLAKEHLMEFSQQITEEYLNPEFPPFFKDYLGQLQLLQQYDHKKLDKESKRHKKKIKKTVSQMEKWYAEQLFHVPHQENKEESSEYTRTLRAWLALHKQQEWQDRLRKRRTTFHYVKAFSALAALFMALGTTYLIVEAFRVITLVPFALWPMLVVPMALIAGTAYGLLTYNAITDLINNATIQKWYNKLRHDLSTGLTFRKVLIACAAVLLLGLAIALTICTAGTWWTIATSGHPLFSWMRKMPSFIMGIINPAITGLSAICFNVPNSLESLEMLEESLETIEKANGTHSNIFIRLYRSVRDGLAHLGATENSLQILNPFRLILLLTVVPLRVLLFIGHLISIALTSDRMPGVPKIVSDLIAIISEGFEDAHYFIGHSHDKSPSFCAHADHDELHHRSDVLQSHLQNSAGHSHAEDIPGRLLKLFALPIYALAAVWDCLSSKLNQQPQRRSLSLTEAWNKQFGVQPKEKIIMENDARDPSINWQIEQTLFKLSRLQEKNPQVLRVYHDKKSQEPPQTTLQRGDSGFFAQQTNATSNTTDTIVPAFN